MWLNRAFFDLVRIYLTFRHEVFHQSRLYIVSLNLRIVGVALASQARIYHDDVSVRANAARWTSSPADWMLVLSVLRGKSCGKEVVN